MLIHGHIFRNSQIRLHSGSSDASQINVDGQNYSIMIFGGTVLITFTLKFFKSSNQIHSKLHRQTPKRPLNQRDH